LQIFGALTSFENAAQAAPGHGLDQVVPRASGHPRRPPGSAPPAPLPGRDSRGPRPAAIERYAEQLARLQVLEGLHLGPQASLNGAQWGGSTPPGAFRYFAACAFKPVHASPPLRLPLIAG
jgi:hypothetical protein